MESPTHGRGKIIPKGEIRALLPEDGKRSWAEKNPQMSTSTATLDNSLSIPTSLFFFNFQRRLCQKLQLILSPKSLCYDVPYKEPYGNFYGLQFRKTVGAPDELMESLRSDNESEVIHHVSLLT